MANVRGRRGAGASPSGRPNEDTHTNSNNDDGRWRRFFFQAGDCAFLLCVGIAATVVTHMVHELEWRFVPTCLLGMVAAMAIQVFLAVMAAPILGSIESMVPSMIVAMASPMTLCAFHVADHKPTRFAAIVVGSLVAMGMFLFVQFYGRVCDNILQKESVDAPN